MLWVYVILNKSYTPSTCTGCGRWVALRHVWSETISWTIGWGEGHCPIALWIYLSAGDVVAEAFTTYLFFSRLCERVERFIFEASTVLCVFSAWSVFRQWISPVSIWWVPKKACQNKRKIGFARVDSCCAEFRWKCGVFKGEIKGWRTKTKELSIVGRCHWQWSRKNRRGRLGCWCYICIVVGGDRKDNAFLQESSTEDNVF